ncbi:MAG: hypothetical protein K2G67_01400, partial [Muribaculaceae bacterium]|nr:hypothetical protein [Muribaculaceae bacterium]
MKRLSLISLTFVVASVGCLSSWAGRALPSNDFFTDGQSWQIERVAAENTSQASILEVRVDGTVMAEGQYTDKYGTYTISEQCARLVVSENGVQTGEFAAVEIYGKILLYSEKKSAFVPVLDFTCTDGDKVALGDEECNVTRVNYIYPGDILRKKVSGYIGDSTGEYVFGFGAKEFSLSPDYWDGVSTYRTVSMTAANGVTLTDNIFGQAPAETSNEYWTEGKSWSYRHFYPSSSEMPDYYTYKTVKGDTEVDHLACRKLFVCDETWKPVYSDYTAVCDIEGQVYQYSS